MHQKVSFNTTSYSAESSWIQTQTYFIQTSSSGGTCSSACINTTISSYDSHVHRKRCTITDRQTVRAKQNIVRKSLSNEIKRLTQGVREIKGNDAMVFIPKNQVPTGKKVAYANMTCGIRSTKEESIESG